MQEQEKLDLRYVINPEINWYTFREDKVFRSVFSSSLKFIKALLKCTFNFTDKELEEAEIINGGVITPQQLKSKTFTTDIIVKLSNEDIIIIEMQNYNTIKTSNKNTLYADREISMQEIENDDYDKIHKVYQLVIIANNELAKRKHILLEPFTIRGDKYPKHTIMEKYRKTVWLDLKGEIDYATDNKDLIAFVLLLRANTNEEALKSIKYSSLMKEIIKEREEFMHKEWMRTYKEKELENWEGMSEEFKKEGKIQGIEEGKIQGIEEGKIQGIEQTNYEIAKKMLLNNTLSIEEISLYTTLSQEKLCSIKESLQI